MFGINFEAGKILADDNVSSALSAGGTEMQRGIMKRIIDYDKDYRLKKYAKSKTERAILALYIFSKEVESSDYEQLKIAVKTYASSVGVNANFSKIDSSLKLIDGRLYWDP